MTHRRLTYHQVELHKMPQNYRQRSRRWRIRRRQPSHCLLAVCPAHNVACHHIMGGSRVCVCVSVIILQCLLSYMNAALIPLLASMTKDIVNQCPPPPTSNSLFQVFRTDAFIFIKPTDVYREVYIIMIQSEYCDTIGTPSFACQLYLTVLNFYVGQHICCSTYGICYRPSVCLSHGSKTVEVTIMQFSP